MKSIVTIAVLWLSWYRLESVSANGDSCTFTAIHGLEKVLQCPASHSPSCQPLTMNSTSITWCISYFMPPDDDLRPGSSWTMCVARDGVVYTEGDIPFKSDNDVIVDHEGLLRLSVTAVINFEELNDVINCSIINLTTNATCDETSGIRLSIINQHSLPHPLVLGYVPSSSQYTVTAGLSLIMCMHGRTNGVSQVSSTQFLPTTGSSSSIPPTNITGHTNCKTCSCQNDMNHFSRFLTNSSNSVHALVNLRKTDPCQLMFDHFEFYLLIPQASSQTTGDFQFNLFDSLGIPFQPSSSLNKLSVSVVYQSIVPVFHSPLLMPYTSITIRSNANTLIPCNVTMGVGLSLVWEGPGVNKLNSSSCVYTNDEDYLNCICGMEHQYSDGNAAGTVLTINTVSETVYAIENGAELVRRTVNLVICEATPSYDYNFTCIATPGASRVLSVIVTPTATPTGISSSINVTSITLSLSTSVAVSTIMSFTMPITTTTVSTFHLDDSSSNQVVLSFTVVFSLLAAILMIPVIMIIICCFILRKPANKKGIFNTLVDRREFSREQLIFVEKKGEGQFGEVWKAIAPGIVPGKQARNVVAVKHAKESASWIESNIIQEELEIMKTIQPHQNVVNLLGYCTLPVYSPVLIIMEFAEHGNLKDYLVSLRSIVLTKPSDSSSIVSSPYNHSAPTELSSLVGGPCPALSRSSTPISSDEGCFTVDNVCQCNEGGRSHTYVNVAMEIPSNSEHVTTSFCNNSIENGINSIGDHHDAIVNDQLTPIPPPLLSSKFIIETALQIAKGMEHLEKMKCLHRDLAARNILIADGFLLKVSDFGLARDASDKDYYRRMSSNRLPACWMAIESLDSQKIHTHKSDVWSFAVVLWEIHTYGKHPYSSLEEAATCESILYYLKEGKRLPRPDHCTDEMNELMTQCWDVNPSKRPSFSNIVLKLDQMLSIEHGYLALSEQQAAPTAMICSINDPACQLSINAVQSRSCSRSRSRSPFHMPSHSLNSIPHVITPVPCLDDSTDSNQMSSHFPFSSSNVPRHSLSPFAIVSPYSNNSSETLKSQSRSHSHSHSHSPFPPPLSPFQIEPIINQACSNVQEPQSYSSLPPLHSMLLFNSNNSTKARSHSPNPVQSTLESSDSTAIPVPHPPHTRPKNLSLPRLSSHVTSGHVTSSCSPSPRIMIKETPLHDFKSSSSSMSNLTANGTSTGAVSVVYTKKPLTRT